MSDNLLDLDGLEMLRRTPNWGSGIEFSMSYSRNILSFLGTKSEFIDFAGSRVPVEIQNLYVNENKETESELISFFEDREGRLGKFWLLSHTNEFVLASKINQGDLSLKAKANFFESVWLGKERFYLLLKTGDMITRKMASIAGPVAGKITIGVGSEFDRTIEIDEVECFGLLFLVRFSQDSIDITNITSKISTCQVRFFELVSEYS